ncbi:P-loop containing nucleoside triphosphate hydrolase protein [Daldinia caldariorum]|uniref:P-loop containing nucleoside triphosphate hydrolase protein n=1 Tax=Daldinia caldariorum TaxID=326644 RepID=UPI0020082FC7|nr:P-loop containing nucleoside triphosphate hydrolase protein [Daldinia caldariorum]KAI1465542.1 P-loop containing nucleoside triphosphate hydrolase protein [Daldinia caldariorum]
MSDNETVVLVTSSVGLGVVTILSIPAALNLSRLRGRGSKSTTEIYEDKDGKSTPEAVKAFSTKVPKAVMLVLSLIGFGVSILLAVISTLGTQAIESGLFLANWLAVIIWVLLTLQVICVAASRDSVAAYDLGIWSFLSCVVLTAVLTVQDNDVAVLLLEQHSTGVFSIRVVELVVAVCLAVASLSIPRRPDVYYNGQLVDRMYTISAWSKLNWSWPGYLLRQASKKNNLDLADLPRPDHYTRSKDTAADWESRNFTGPLWISIIAAHKWVFALQWILTILTAFLKVAPQWVVLQLLNLLEHRQGNERLGREAWVWVILIAVVVLVQSWVESYIYWLSWAQICVPIRAQLSALIFQKSMRRKDVKEASIKQKKAAAASGSTEPTVAGPIGEASINRLQLEDFEEEDEAEQIKKSKQSTVNLIGVDAKRVSDFAAFNNTFLGSLLKLIVSLLFLAELLGWKALLAGFSTMLVVTPINIYFSKRYSDAQDRLMKVRDEKMEVVSEALQGIRQIKFSALEPQWEKKIGDVRERELTCVWSAFVNDVMLIGCWITSPIMLAAVSLAVYAALYGALSPSVAFVSLGVFKALEVTLSVIPELTTDLVDAWISVKRMDAYLRSAEISKVIKEADEVTFDNASIAWPSDNQEDDDEDPDRFVLRDVNITFPKGELSVISGRTGSGKSLMLAAILGEVDILAGSISVPRAPSQRHDQKANRDNWIIPGAVAFVAQIPWIENATVKENILFGLPYDAYRYNKTIEVCALTKDMEMFSDGENTEIGANGINLSGGQKWRITLARAIYSRAGILILDDIFSAVDAHVGRHIFEKCLNGELSVGRTRILVTHHVALCEPKTKYLVELGDGRVLNAGLVSELEQTGTLEQIKSHEQTDQEIREDEGSTAINSEETSETDIEPNGESLVKVLSRAQARKFVEEEAREKGAVKGKVYAAYLNYSGSWWFWSMVVVLFLFVEALTIGRSWWLRLWTASDEEHQQNIQVQSHKHASAYQFNVQQFTMATMIRPMVTIESSKSLVYYLGIYVFLSTFTSLVSTYRYYYIFHGSVRASRQLFAKLNFVVLRAPLRWLDTVPLGRILNRFTADFHSVDTHMAYSLAFAATALLNLIGVIVASLFVSPVIIILAFFLLLVCAFYAIRYLHGARPVKRLESVTKSPVFEQFGSALTGVQTIRSFDKSQTYIERMYTKLDDWTVATWHLWLFIRWMGWRMAVVGSFFASFVATLILIAPEIDAALAGFGLAFALEFSDHVMWTIRHYANVELEMNAAERIVEYTELPTESLEGVSPPAAWPTEGCVEVDNLVISYAEDLPPVLKGLSFTIERNQRVGVVGRTGAGKSSLTLALFRFLEARSGSILIDGLDISKIKLHDLRSRLAIIPQDPVLFSGTVRSNLDPFDNHTDAELFDSLARVHLISESEYENINGNGTVSGTPGISGTSTPVSNNSGRKKNTNIFRNLRSPISEGGLNLSQGQRQLLCLARAIVSRPKVMVLDEATSAVDMSTDALIQRSIREEFGDSTLVVIAHRLSTIADFDRILVLSDGKVAEYGSPQELWELEGNEEGGVGMFRAMCEQSGETEHLRKVVFGEA